MILDLFAGAGGWDEGIRRHLVNPLPVVGLEIDAAACQTRAAAGHLTIRTDVATYPTGPFAGKVTGLIASPPCQSFSRAGKRRGLDDPRGELVWQPLRWAEALLPEWIALEQVPDVLPMWQAALLRLRELGYQGWTGILNSADYGIVQACPLHATDSQTSNVDSAQSSYRSATEPGIALAPATTRFDEEAQSLAGIVAAQLDRAMRPAFAGSATCGERVQRLEVLAASVEPTTLNGSAVAVWTNEGTSAFGLTPATAANIASLLSNCLAAPSLAVRWSTTSTRTQRTIVQQTSRCIAATLITGCGTGPATREAGCGLCVDIAVPQTRERAVLIARHGLPVGPPEPTHAELGSGMFGGHQPWIAMADAIGWGFTDRPALTIVGASSSGGRRGMDGGSGARAAVYRAQIGNTWKWKAGRPAKVGKFDHGSMVLAPREAAVLQSFPAGYPWQGTTQLHYLQAGNAVPPLLAAHVVAAVSGMSWRSGLAVAS